MKTTTAPIATISQAQRVADDLDSLTQRILGDLEALFVAVQDATDRHPKANQLAGIGKYLAQDWANLLASNLEELQAALADVAGLEAKDAPAKEDAA
ncbi:hypothetical protein [Imhoffiella purpurea]|uniref:Uncharacterized protein n=1 Tax=Imhoffiella purpurea TaxID=1249627 RepID=W9VFR3_9GAMM|nr:hypothetical protein [Imhoffiella purpurea]EXJ14862.1 hypothetical protein D779_2068 [Imhoffiella purpurea]